MNYIITVINASLQALFHIGKRFFLKSQYSNEKNNLYVKGGILEDVYFCENPLEMLTIYMYGK